MSGVGPQVSPGSLFCPYVGIDGLHAHVLFALFAEMTDNLGRRPLFLCDLFTNKLTQFNGQVPAILQPALPVVSFYLRLLMVVAALTAIALQFPAERGLGDIYGLTYLFSTLFCWSKTKIVYLCFGVRWLYFFTTQNYLIPGRFRSPFFLFLCCI